MNQALAHLLAAHLEPMRIFQVIDEVALGDLLERSKRLIDRLNALVILVSLANVTDAKAIINLGGEMMEKSTKISDDGESNASDSLTPPCP